MHCRQKYFSRNGVSTARQRKHVAEGSIVSKVAHSSHVSVGEWVAAGPACRLAARPTAGQAGRQAGRQADRLVGWMVMCPEAAPSSPTLCVSVPTNVRAGNIEQRPSWLSVDQLAGWLACVLGWVAVFLQDC